MVYISAYVSAWQFFQQYPVIAIVVYGLIPFCVIGYTVIMFRKIIASRKMIDKPMSWAECKRYSDRIAAQYPDESEAEPVAIEKPVLSNFEPEISRVEWGDWSIENQKV